MTILTAYITFAITLAALNALNAYMLQMRTPARMIETVTASSFVDSKRMVRNDVIRTISRATGEVIEQRWFKTDTVVHAKYRELLDFIGDTTLVPRDILNECYGVRR